MDYIAIGTDYQKKLQSVFDLADASGKRDSTNAKLFHKMKELQVELDNDLRDRHNYTGPDGGALFPILRKIRDCLASVDHCDSPEAWDRLRAAKRELEDFLAS